MKCKIKNASPKKVESLEVYFEADAGDIGHLFQKSGRIFSNLGELRRDGIKFISHLRWKAIRLGAGEGIAQAAGFRPERLARVSGEHRTMENVQTHFREKRDDLYSRYRLALAPEDKRRVVRDMQRFNLEARKYRGVIPPSRRHQWGRLPSKSKKSRLLGLGN
jgi:hypothetical protein